MPLFGPVHLALLATVALLSLLAAAACRRLPRARRPLRLTVGWGVAANEIVWWIFRYSHEGLRFPHNLPLQLCDVTVWTTVAACLTLAPRIVEFGYFAGLAGSGMALATPDLWTPWPSYPAIYFFVAHGGIAIGIAAVVFGGIAPLRPGAVWRAFGMLLAYTGLVGIFNAVFKTNYMYLCAKPASASALDLFGPWPGYLAVSAAVALGLFWLLWLPARPVSAPPATRRQQAGG
ncbi:MAG TPA: TIGR02206 family membrane protein [Bryobacteraceae bacterium]|nr:TIGR02206 family membrane protein [Bryobacteraceae bacterium]